MVAATSARAIALADGGHGIAAAARYAATASDAGEAGGGAIGAKVTPGGRPAVLGRKSVSVILAPIVKECPAARCALAMVVGWLK